MSVKVLLADDHPIVRQGLHRLLETEAAFQVIAETSDGLETIQAVEQYRPDVIVVDLMMPGLNGLEVTRQVHERQPQVRIIILSMHHTEAYVIQAMRNGASGYVLKDSPPEELIQAIYEVQLGKRFLSPKLSQLVDKKAIISAEEGTTHEAYERLTDRERQVLQLIVEGCTTAVIAQRLAISPRTVEIHRANLMHKLGFTSFVELVRFAIKHGILPLES